MLALQETKLTSKSKLKPIDNYTIVRKDRSTNKGGGLAFYIHKSITFNNITTPPPLETDNHLEELSININGLTGDIHIRNFYIPPQSSCTPGYAAPTDMLISHLTGPALILGDLNGHSKLWHSNVDEDARGRLMANSINDSDLGILNEDSPTRVTAACSSSPDISLSSSDLLPCSTWTALPALSSDHLPIIVSLKVNISKSFAPQKTYINFEKADWEGFQDFTEGKFANLPPPNDPIKGEKTFKDILNKATKLFIPSGRIN